MHNNKRRSGGMNGGGQHRHNNNRGRRFTPHRGDGGMSGGNDAASVSRTRRMALQNKEKYQMMARDAMSMGDRVLAESHLQHADHYHRVLLSLPPEEAPRPQYLNPQNAPQNDGQQQGNPQQDPRDGNDNGAQAQHSHAPQQHSQHQPHASHGGGLPSFITGSGNPEE